MRFQISNMFAVVELYLWPGGLVDLLVTGDISLLPKSTARSCQSAGRTSSTWFSSDHTFLSTIDYSLQKNNIIEYTHKDLQTFRLAQNWPQASPSGDWQVIIISDPVSWHLVYHCHRFDFTNVLQLLLMIVMSQFLSDPSPIIGYACHSLTDWLTPV